MEKKLGTYIILATLFVAMFAIVVPKGVADHAAEVTWIVYPGSTQVLVDPYTISTHWPDLYTVYSPSPQAHVTGTQVHPLVFIVNNTGTADYITSVEVFIQQDLQGFSYFYLNDTKVTRVDLVTDEPNWVYETIESDPNREVRGFRFKALSSQFGIAPGNALAFWMYFRGGPQYCRYEFTVITHDDGYPTGGRARAYVHHIWVVMDDFPPIIDSFTPADGATVNGLPLPCGNHYFPIDIIARDDPQCSSGINGATFLVLVRNATTGQVIWNSSDFTSGIIKTETGANYKMQYNSTNDTWKAHFEVQAYQTRIGDLPEGYYNITVTIKDRVGNAETETHKIYYVPPLIPEYTASPETWIKDSKTGLVESKQVIYKNKVLGSTVTLTDTGFKPNTKVYFRIYIPTYKWYNWTYGTFNVLVCNTTAAADGSVTGTFIFPKAPQGRYTVFIEGTGPDGKPLTKYKTVKVVCEIIFDPDEIIGPAVIDVMATGLLHPISEYQTTYLLIRETSWGHPKDALMGVNGHITYSWYIDGNGTLQAIRNPLSLECLSDIRPGFYMPVMQPGTYEITLLVLGEFDLWLCNSWSSLTEPAKIYYCTSQTNIVKVKDWTGDILKAAQDAASAANAAKTAAEGAKSSADAAKSSADAAKSAADAAKSSADAATSAANEAKSSADAAKSSADAAKSSADSAKGYAQSAAEGVDGAKKAAEGLTIPVYLAVIFSLIAAIIAAACAILVYRKIA